MREPNRLSARYVEHARPGRHSDGGGLSLLVKSTGTRSWTLRVTVDGKRRDYGLGSYPSVTLAAARQKATAMRRDLAGGKEPRRSEPPTFAEAAEATHTMLLPTWRNPDHAHEWLDSLRRHAASLMGQRCDRITRADVLDVLEPIWLAKPETARRVRQRIRKVMSWAMARHEGIVSNPAGEGIDGALVPQPKVQAHQRALDWREVPAALEAVAASTASDAAKRCLRFTVLTWTRSGEARGARWDEIDFDAETWTVPTERMKGGRPHRVPLSRQALDVLDAARKLDDGSGLVFPSPQRPGEPLTWEALLKLLRTNGLDTTVHGFRAAGRTWAEETTGTAWAVMEAALAHVKGSVERAYARSDLFDQRREVMQQWADFCCSVTTSDE